MQRLIRSFPSSPFKQQLARVHGEEGYVACSPSYPSTSYAVPRFLQHTACIVKLSPRIHASRHRPATAAFQRQGVAVFGPTKLAHETTIWWQGSRRKKANRILIARRFLRNSIGSQDVMGFIWAYEFNYEPYHPSTTNYNNALPYTPYTVTKRDSTNMLVVISALP